MRRTITLCLSILVWVSTPLLAQQVEGLRLRALHEAQTLARELAEKQQPTEGDVRVALKITRETCKESPDESRETIVALEKALVRGYIPDEPIESDLGSAPGSPQGKKPIQNFQLELQSAKKFCGFLVEEKQQATEKPEEPKKAVSSENSTKGAISSENNQSQKEKPAADGDDEVIQKIDEFVQNKQFEDAFGLLPNIKNPSKKIGRITNTLWAFWLERSKGSDPLDPSAQNDLAKKAREVLPGFALQISFWAQFLPRLPEAEKPIVINGVIADGLRENDPGQRAWAFLQFSLVVMATNQQRGNEILGHAFEALRSLNNPRWETVATSDKFFPGLNSFNFAPLAKLGAKDSPAALSFIDKRLPKTVQALAWLALAK